MWSDDLAALILEFENQAAPCNSFTNTEGKTFEEFIKTRLEGYTIVLSITFEYDFTTNPYQIIADQLVKGKFD